MHTAHACFPPHGDEDACLAFHRDILGFGVRESVGSGRTGGISADPSGQPERDLGEVASEGQPELREATPV